MIEMNKYRLKNDDRVFILKKSFNSVGLFEIEGSEKFDKFNGKCLRDSRVINFEKVEIIW